MEEGSRRNPSARIKQRHPVPFAGDRYYARSPPSASLGAPASPHLPPQSPLPTPPTFDSIYHSDRQADGFLHGRVVVGNALAGGRRSGERLPGEEVIQQAPGHQLGLVGGNLREVVQLVVGDVDPRVGDQLQLGPPILLGQKERSPSSFRSLWVPGVWGDSGRPHPG